MFNRVKGTQDFLDLTLFNFFLSSLKKHLGTYNFTEIKTPILEPTDLFKRSLGTETDVVTKEMYTVNTGSDSESICLRPENTAAIVRAFVNNGIQVTPWKVFEWGAIFRHERPQKGRYREFHQVSIEIIGSNSVSQDAHFIKMLDRFFAEVLQIDTIALLINFLGCAQDRINFKNVLHDFLSSVEQGICATCTERKEKNVMRVYDCKNPQCQELYTQAPALADYLCPACSQEWITLKHTLEALSVSYSYAPRLVRGLDYYGKTVFEFVSVSLGAQNAVCGGGRYNQLVKDIGSKEDHPSIGVGIGIERVLLLLENQKEKLALSSLPPLHVIIPFEQEQYASALLLADELQANNLRTDILLEDESVKSMMRKANKLDAQYVLLIGPDEQAQQVVTVKNMSASTEQRIAHKDLVSYLLAAHKA
ncbi:histidine--tRNA ligase [Candidatus Dependentiae bacterium]|nr:histidine--tRNA ligase [Candidatus Dependentiae bacterium]